MKHRQQAALCAAILAAGALARAADLSLPEAQRAAVERSRSVAASEASIEAARHMAAAAGELPDPVLKLGVDNVPAQGPDAFSVGTDGMTMRRIGVMQEVTRGEKRILKRERFEREALRAAAEKDASIAAIERDTAIAWLERHYAEAMARAAAEQVDAARAEVESADSAWRAGRGSQADVFAARSALALARDRATELDARVRTSRIELARWVGAAAAEPLAPAPALDRVDLPAGDLEPHLEGHPEIAALDRQAEAADAQARLADAARRPDWTWEATYQVRGPAYSNMFSIGVSLPLPWDAANRQDREAAAKRAEAEEVRARRDEALRAHASEVARMREEWKSGRERQSRFRAEIVPLSLERTRAAVAAYGGGRASLGEVLAARRAETETSLQALQLDLEVARLWARLSYLVPSASAGAPHAGETR